MRTKIFLLLLCLALPAFAFEDAPGDDATHSTRDTPPPSQSERTQQAEEANIPPEIKALASSDSQITTPTMDALDQAAPDREKVADLIEQIEKLNLQDNERYKTAYQYLKTRYSTDKQLADAYKKAGEDSNEQRMATREVLSRAQKLFKDIPEGRSAALFSAYANNRALFDGLTDKNGKASLDGLKKLAAQGALDRDLNEAIRRYEGPFDKTTVTGEQSQAFYQSIEDLKKEQAGYHSFFNENGQEYKGFRDKRTQETFFVEVSKDGKTYSEAIAELPQGAERQPALDKLFSKYSLNLVKRDDTGKFNQYEAASGANGNIFFYDVVNGTQSLEKPVGLDSKLAGQYNFDKPTMDQMLFKYRTQGFLWNGKEVVKSEVLSGDFFSLKEGANMKLTVSEGGFALVNGELKFMAADGDNNAWSAYFDKTNIYSVTGPIIQSETGRRMPYLTKEGHYFSLNAGAEKNGNRYNTIIHYPPAQPQNYASQSGQTQWNYYNQGCGT